MCGELDSAVADAVITPALDLRLKPVEEEDFYDGCKFDKPEILTSCTGVRDKVFLGGQDFNLPKYPYQKGNS